jgi:hypothetical protein
MGKVASGVLTSSTTCSGVTKAVDREDRSCARGTYSVWFFFLDHPTFLGHRPPCLGCVYLRIQYMSLLY